MTEDKTLFWLWLSLICGPGSKSADSLLESLEARFPIFMRRVKKSIPLSQK